MTAITLALSVTSSVKALTVANNAGLKFSESVRAGVTAHGLGEFACALLDNIRGAALMGEKAMRKAGTDAGSLFSKYTLAVRVLKSMAAEGWELKISAKEGAATTTEQVEKKANTKGKGDNGDNGESREQDSQAGAAIMASRSESLSRLLAEAGDAAILEAFSLMLAAGHKSAVARTIAAAIAFGNANKSIGDDIKHAVPEMAELLKLAA